MRRRTTRALGTIAGLSGAALTAGAQTYTLVDLGTLGGQSSAFALGAGERAGGSATGANAHFVGVVYAGSVTPVPPPAGMREGVVTAFDAGGRAVLLAYSLGEPGVASYTVDDAGLRVPLGAFAARAANAAGDIAGTANDPTASGFYFPRATLLHGGVLTTLPTLGGLTSQALGLDASGWVVGSSTTTGEAATRPCVWTVGGGALDLGTLGGAGGQAMAVVGGGAAGGRAVGASQVTGGAWHATRWTLDATGHATARTDLGVLPGAQSSFAHGVNAAGVVVGTSGFHAVAWRGAVAVDLNTVVRFAPGASAGWTLENAWAIGDDGTIVGDGSYLGYPRAFLLRPCDCAMVCPADFDGSGGTPDATDIDAFFTAWLSGAACADVDCSGGTPDATDIDVFFVAWLAGGC